jgi:hypothetical protein
MGTFPYERSSIERGQIAIDDVTLRNELASGASDSAQRIVRAKLRGRVGRVQRHVTGTILRLFPPRSLVQFRRHTQAKRQPIVLR